MSYTEEAEIPVNFAKRQAAPNLSVDVIYVIMVLDIPGKKKLYIPLNCARYLSTGRDSPHQTGHRDFEINEYRRAGFLC